MVELPISSNRHLPEQFAEALDVLVEERRERLRRAVATGEAGAAGADDRVDVGVRNPGADDGADRVHVIAHDVPCRQAMRPAARARSASKSPERSSAAVRVSETVSRAMASEVAMVARVPKRLGRFFAEKARRMQFAECSSLP